MGILNLEFPSQQESARTFSSPKHPPEAPTILLIPTWGRKVDAVRWFGSGGVGCGTAVGVGGRGGALPHGPHHSISGIVGASSGENLHRESYYV